MGLLPKAIQIIKTESVFKLLARTQITIFGFEGQKFFQEIENTKYEYTNGCDVDRCELRKIIDCARATSAAAAAAAALPLLLGVCALCYTAAMRRLSIDATGARWAVCAWGVLCDVRVSAQRAHSMTTFFADRSRL